MSPRERSGSDIRRTIRRWLITGAALLVPLVVTLAVLGAVLNFVSQLLNPLVRAAAMWLGFVDADAQVDRAVVKVSTVIATIAAIFLLGGLADAEPTDGRIADGFHEAMESIPGLGSIYTGFRQMSEVVVESDVDSFQDVKLVEYPTEGSYTFAFVTADTPVHIQEATERGDMVTLFMPMAPNPVMGGFVVNVDRDRVVDIDMTVEEGVRALVTSGVTVTDDVGGQEIPPERLRRLGVQPAPETADPGTERVTDGAVDVGPDDDIPADADADTDAAPRETSSNGRPPSDERE
jgi:uncharacterized membrane protein